MTGHRLLLAGASALFLVGCAGDDDASRATTLVPLPIESTSTTKATAPEATPTSPETSPPTLPAEPTTTPPNNDQLRQDVIDAVVASWTAFNELLLDPDSAEKVEAVATALTDRALDRAIEIAVSYRVSNQAERTHAEHPAGVVIDDESLVVDSAGVTATIEYCRLGSNVWVEVAANPDGTDRVIDDTINSYLESDTFSLVDGRWVKQSGVTIARYEGELQCPSAA